ncbi:outer membrane protein assembly factor BamE [Kaarinaea lacus]
MTNRVFHKQMPGGKIIILPSVVFAAVLFLLSACSIHVIDVQQGNAITQELVGKLKIGMKKQQVARLLGTPLINDPFHYDRWDYVYQFVAGDTGEKQSSSMTLFFVGNDLSRIDIKEAPPTEEDIRRPTIRTKR